MKQHVCRVVENRPSAEAAREFLAAGACAVEIDRAEWIEPGMAEGCQAMLNE